jgi:hypothetical protein
MDSWPCGPAPRGPKAAKSFERPSPEKALKFALDEGRHRLSFRHCGAAVAQKSVSPACQNVNARELNRQYSRIAAVYGKGSTRRSIPPRSMTSETSAVCDRDHGGPGAFTII